MVYDSGHTFWIAQASLLHYHSIPCCWSFLTYSTTRMTLKAYKCSNSSKCPTLFDCFFFLFASSLAWFRRWSGECDEATLSVQWLGIIRWLIRGLPSDPPTEETPSTQVRSFSLQGSKAVKEILGIRGKPHESPQVAIICLSIISIRFNSWVLLMKWGQRVERSLSLPLPFAQFKLEVINFYWAFNLKLLLWHTFKSSKTLLRRLIKIFCE